MSPAPSSPRRVKSGRRRGGAPAPEPRAAGESPVAAPVAATLAAATLAAAIARGETGAVARGITLASSGSAAGLRLLELLPRREGALRVGVTGPPGAGKSTLIGALLREFRGRGVRVAVIACDPASPITGGAFLGDRMRMSVGEGAGPEPFIRSFASRGPGAEPPAAAGDAARILEAAGFEIIILETPGAGQNDTGLGRFVDLVLVVLSPEAGDEFQMLKAGLIEVADLLVVNQGDRPGAAALARILREEVAARGGEAVPVLETVATRGEGVSALAESIELHRSARHRAKERA